MEVSLATADGQPLVEIARNRDGTISSSGGVVTLVFAFPVELLQGIGAGVDASGTARHHVPRQEQCSIARDWTIARR